MKILDIGSITAHWLSKIAQMAVVALAAIMPASAASANSPATDFYCEYGDNVASKRQSSGFNFSFQPDVPYDFIDMFGFGHSIRSTTVTRDQVVEQSVMMTDNTHPSRAESFGLIVMDRRTMKFRRLIYSVDQQTHESKVEMDRSGQCAPVKPRAAR
jgi:hypothetical protein